MELESGQLRQLTRHPEPDWYPRLSPDGREVAFYSVRSGNRDVWVLGMDGGGELQLTSYPGIDCCPSWSPDGSRLVYASSRPTREFYEVPRQGGEPRFIHRTNKLASVAEWAPDGKWLAFPEDGLWRIPVTGGDVELLLATVDMLCSTEIANPWEEWLPR